MISAPPANQRPDLTQSIVRGAIVNTFGSAGKLLYPVFLLLITRIYGPSAVGVFLLTLSTVELASCVVIEGFDTGVVTFGSRHASGDGDGDEELFYQVFASALQWSLALSIGAAVLAALTTGGIVTALVLPPMAFTCIAIAATRARCSMTSDALINGFVRPVALLAAAVALGLRAPTISALYIAYVAAQVICAAAALAIVLRLFSFRRLAAQVIRRRPLPGLFRFGMTSGVGSLSNALTANAPIIMLGAYGVAPASIAYFGTALMIASNMRQIRFVFSTAFAPVAARLHASGEEDQLAAAYSTATRWSLGFTLPVIALFGIFHAQVMQFIHPSYTGNATFIFVLLLIPVLRCSVAGVALLSSGYAGWSLFNNLMCGVVTLGGAWWLVPRYGITGAAAAASAGVVVITAAELLEARRFLKLRLGLTGGRRSGLRARLGESDRPSPYPSAPY